MSRRLRFWVPGGIYHLTVRGNNRERIFFDELDCQQYLLELRQARRTEPHDLLAFALMPNHVHLVVESRAEGSISRMMQRVATSYARYFNGRHHHIGHVYQGRFYSNAVTRESYLLEVTRYVHLNPVRAGLARTPSDYQWSSYGHYLQCQPDSFGWVKAGRILGLFGQSEATQRVRYKQFVEELVEREADFKRMERRLQKEKQIPPRRWLQKVTDTFPLQKVTDTF